VFMEKETEGRKRKKVTAARIPQNVAPAARLFDPFAATAGHSRARAGVHRDPITMAECGRETRIPVAPSGDSRPWPYFRTENLESVTIIRSATGEKHPDAVRLLGQLPENRAKPIRRCQPEI
jgi:hypothetical protein